MKLRRRCLLILMAATAALAGISKIGWAGPYPARPVRVIVGYPAGTSSDIAARLIAQRLSEQLDQQFIVENRPGAGTNLATEAVVRAIPDGYTLLVVTQTNAINATLYKDLSFNFVQDIRPVASLMRVPGVMEVTPSFPAKTIGEFVSYAKANPGKINMGSGGNGSLQHLFGELFASMTGIKMTHIPYPRANPLPDLLAGQIQVMFAPLPSSIEQIRAGRLRALAVTTAQRIESLPDIPTVAEFVPGYEASGWFGIGAPKDTPTEVIDKLNEAINTALAEAKMKDRIDDIGATVLTSSPTAFGKLIADETQKWANVLKAANIQVD